MRKGLRIRVPNDHGVLLHCICIEALSHPIDHSETDSRLPGAFVAFVHRAEEEQFGM
jgi:hypothetical protein